MNTSLGPLTVASTEKGLASINFGRSVPLGGIFDLGANSFYMQQIEEYFQSRRTGFDFPLDVDGTPFQIAVWRELMKIPYGQTSTYGDVAKKLGNPGAARAVGMANHVNRIPIVIPCHRVVGHDGSLTGYAGGLHVKKQLLSIEKAPTLFRTT